MSSLQDNQLLYISIVNFHIQNSLQVWLILFSVIKTFWSTEPQMQKWLPICIKYLVGRFLNIESLYFL